MAGNNGLLTRKGLTRRALRLQLLGFGLVITPLWLDELSDLPHLLPGAEPTAVNWHESVFESLVVVVIAGQTFAWMYRALRRIRYLEGFLIICADCNRLRLRDQWVPLHAYVTLHSDATFSHGIRPDCGEKSYGDQDWWQKMRRDGKVDTGEASRNAQRTSVRDAKGSTPGFYARRDV